MSSVNFSEEELELIVSALAAQEKMCVHMCGYVTGDGVHELVTTSMRSGRLREVIENRGGK